MAKPLIYFNDELIEVKITPEQLQNEYDSHLNASMSWNLIVAALIADIGRAYSIGAGFHFYQWENHVINGRVLPFEIKVVLKELRFSEKSYGSSMEEAWRSLAERICAAYSRLIVYQNN